MLKLDCSLKKFVEPEQVPWGAAGLKEREHLQECIFNSPAAFFAEIDEDFFILGKENLPSDKVLDRIDLLAVDHDGNSVIVELKRGSNKWQLSQALSYAAMVEEWGQGKEFLEKIKDSQREALEKFLEVDVGKLNRSQRVIMVAEAYDYEVLITAEWLNRAYGLDITCCMISLAQDSPAGDQYVSCVKILPAAEPTDLAIARRGPRGTCPAKQKDWSQMLADCKNEAVVQYFRKRLAENPRKNSNDDALAYPSAGTIRWYLEVKSRTAVVVQRRRFQTAEGENDERYWTRLSGPELRPFRNRTYLRFYLKTSEDCDVFEEAVQKSAAFKWTKGDDLDGK